MSWNVAMKFRTHNFPEKRYRTAIFFHGWNKGRDKKFCITSDRISGFPVSAVLCDIPQLSRHNRSKREITAESILELDWWFLRGWWENAVGKKSPLRIEFQTNMFLQKYGTRRPNIYDISNFLFPLQLFFTLRIFPISACYEKLTMRGRSSVRTKFGQIIRKK